MTAVLDRLRERLGEARATLLEQAGDGPFTQLTYQAGDVIVRLVSEYGT